MKMPGPEGVITVLGDQQVACRIEVANSLGRRNVHVVAGPSMDHGECKEKPKVHKMAKAGPEGQTKKVPLCPDRLDKKVIIRAEITEEDQRRLIMFLRNNEDIFAWSPKDFQGVSR